MENTKVYEEVLAAAHFLKESTDLSPDLAFVLGSGFVSFTDFFGETLLELSYDQIPFFPSPQVEGHSAKLKLIEHEGLILAFFIGRPHLYEGWNACEVAFPVRLIYEWGIRRLLFLNSVGSLDHSIQIGDLVLVYDHINMTGHNPLRGENVDFWGKRFPDMNLAYHRPLREAFRDYGGLFKEGIYLGVMGPNYETPAEIQAFKKMGAHVVGMSGVCEVIAATHLDMDFAMISCVSNHCLDPKAPIEHRHVLSETERKLPFLFEITDAYLREIGSSHEN